jgi:hypothetical protein
MQAIKYCESYTEVVDASLAKGLIFGEWDSVLDLTTRLVSRAERLQSSEFEAIDKEFVDSIFKNFNQYKDTEFYYSNTDSQTLFLETNVPSIAFNTGQLILTLYVMGDFCTKET